MGGRGAGLELSFNSPMLLRPLPLTTDSVGQSTTEELGRHLDMISGIVVVGADAGLELISELARLNVAREHVVDVQDLGFVLVESVK